MKSLPGARLSKPLTPAEAHQLVITSIGPLCENRALCPPARWVEDASDDGELIPDAEWEWMHSDPEPGDYIAVHDVSDWTPEKRAIYEEYMRRRWGIEWEGRE